MTQLNKLINSVKELEREAEEIDKKVTGWLSYYFTYSYINDLDTEMLWLEESFREEQRKYV